MHSILRRHQRGVSLPRTIAIMIVLVCLLTIPLWWNKSSNDKPKINNKAGQIQAPGGASDRAATGPQSASPDRLGLSFGHGKFTNPSDVTRLLHSSCDGEPKDAGNANSGLCNISTGDTSCRTALPILCIMKDGSTAQASGLVPVEIKPVATLGTSGSATTATAGTSTVTNTSTSATSASASLSAEADKETPDQALQAAWSSGVLGATAPVAGFVLSSEAAANARCAAELGSGWRMADITDAASGKALVGKRGQGLVNSDIRHWVHAKNQKAHCWNPS